MFSPQRHTNQLWPVIQPHIDRMCPKPPADDHRLSVRINPSGAPWQEKLVLRRHHASQTRDPDGSAVEMSAKRQIRTPFTAGIKKEGRMK